MKKSTFFLGIIACGVLFTGLVLIQPVKSAPLAWHGTPDPNATPQVTAAADSSITYYSHIKPLMDRHCLGCHLAGRIGAQAFTMDDPAVVQRHADEIAFETATRQMPPWLPSADSVDFQHERRLTDDEIALFQAWHNADAPLGDPASATSVVESVIPEVRHDLTLEMPLAYTPDSNLSDDYRCFLIDPQIEEAGFITGYDIQPGDLTIVHHVLVFQIIDLLGGVAQQLDSQDEAPGWQCYGGSRVGDDTTIAAWSPGDVARLMPEGAGFQVNPGDQFIMQVHYFLEKPVQPDQTKVSFQWSDEALEPLFMAAFTAPVEIPCPQDINTIECERDTALENNRKYYATPRQNADGDLRNCQKTLADYLTQDASHVESSCDLAVPFNALLVELLPHMHTRGKSIRVELNPGTPDAQILIDIPAWDFHWQGSYQLVEPMAIQRGTTVRLTCVWDNTRDENPHYIVWGEGTQDEMCLTYLTFMAGQ